MRIRPRIGIGIATLIWATTALPGLGVSAQSPDVSPAVSPTASLVPCPAMTQTRSPFVTPGTYRIEAFGHQDDPLPDPSAPVRFHAGEDWGSPDIAGAGVVPVGAGRVLAVGTIDGDQRGGIVVIEHTGPFSVPASTPGEPWSYPGVDVDSILTVYEGIDPTPGLAVGACVTSDALIGTVSPQCVAGRTGPCIARKVALHLELRLPSTVDPSQHSLDWADVGPAGASSEGYFLDPQLMVDSGLREPTTFLATLAAPCPSPSLAPDASAEPCVTPPPQPTPLPTLAPTPMPTASPAPTRKPIRSPAADLLAGIPAGVRDTCVPRSTGLVTGTIAAVDCQPDPSRIKLLTYFLLRPADARFVFSSRMRQYDLATGADCHAGVPGIESKRASLSIGCFVDGDGHANLRFASRAACPGIYVGVLGTGGDVAALATAYDAAVGAPWQDPGSSLAACRSGGTGVSAPPAPTNVAFKVHTNGQDSDGFPRPYRLQVTWDTSVSADTTIEVWAVTECPATATRRHPQLPCLTRSTPLPASIRQRVASAPAGDGSVAWMVPGWEILGGPVAVDGEVQYWGVVVRAVNANGASRFVIARNGNGEACFDCTY
jgi:hypothetical protein